MSKKSYFAVIAVFLVGVAVGLVVWQKQKLREAPKSEMAGAPPLPMPVSVSPAVAPPVAMPEGVAIMPRVAYTESGFAPAVLNAKKGNAVVFHNESSKGVWPASAVHPSHKVYPTTGGCIGSTFDACKLPPENHGLLYSKCPVLGNITIM